MHLFKSKMRKLIFIALTTNVIFPAHAFKVISSGGFVAWPSNTISYKISQNGSDSFDAGFDGNGAVVSEFDIIHDAFFSWSNIENTNLHFNYKGTSNKKETGIDGENTVIWIEKDWKKLAFFPPAGALAVTISSFDLDKGTMIDGDLHFNGQNFNWAHIDSDVELNKIDLKSIATHEIGHFIGLDHSSDDPIEGNSELKLASMYYAASPGEIGSRTLESDDMLGAQHLYPLKNDIETPFAEKIIPESTSNANYQISLSIYGSDFSDLTVVRLLHRDKKGPDLVADSVFIENSGELLALFKVSNAVPGTYHVSVSNSRYDKSTLNESFEITARPGYKYTNVNQGYYYSSGGCGTISSSDLSGGQNEKDLFFVLIALCILSNYLLRRNKRKRFI